MKFCEVLWRKDIFLRIYFLCFAEVGTDPQINEKVNHWEITVRDIHFAAVVVSNTSPTETQVDQRIKSTRDMNAVVFLHHLWYSKEQHKAVKL